MSEIETFLFDCDGVIWRGNELVPKAAQTLQWLRDQGKQIYFVTNNSTKSRKGYLERFLSLNLQANENEIFPSSYAGALYLSRADLSFESNKKVFMIGESGLSEELECHGIPFTRECDFNRYEDINAVIVGLDRSINYQKIDFAQQCLNNNRNCLFVATNTDSVTNISPTRTAPGNGFIVGALKGCTGRDPIVAGKPSSLLIDLIVQSKKLNSSKICMVGDRLDTDILFGNQNNLLTCLVMTGVTTPDILQSNRTPARPDFVLDSMADLCLS